MIPVLGRPQLPASALLLGGLLVSLAPLLGVARAADGGSLSYAVAASLVSLLPGAVALSVGRVRPAAALPIVAGAGLMWSARLAADVGAVLGLAVAERADLLYETAGAQRPLGLGAGSVVLLIGDLVMVAAGGLAMRRWAGDPDGDRVGGGHRRRRPVTVLGVLALLGLSAGYLLTPYTGGYLAARPVTAAFDFGPTAATVLMLAVGGIFLVLVAGRAEAWPLLVGAALSAAAPGVAALLVGASSAGVRLGVAPWLSVAAALLLGVCAVVRLPNPLPRLPAVGTAGLTWVAVGSGLLAAGCAVIAWRSPAVLLGGMAEPSLGDRPTAGVGGAFLFTAAVSGAAAVLAAVPRIGRIGRSALTLLWAPMGSVVFAALADLSVVSVGSVPALSDGRTYDWTAGSGTWWGTAGFALSVVAAGAAVLANREQDENCPDEPDPDAWNRYQDHSRWSAGGLAVLAVVVGVLPVFGTAVRSGPTALHTSGIDGVGVDLLTVAIVIGAAALGWSHHRGQLIGLGAVAAVMSCQRLVIPDGARGMPDLRLALGFPAVLVLAAALLLGTGWQYLRLRRVPLVGPGLSPGSGVLGSRR